MPLSINSVLAVKKQKMMNGLTKHFFVCELKLFKTCDWITTYFVSLVALAL